jgi:hypothetical protein
MSSHSKTAVGALVVDVVVGGGGVVVVVLLVLPLLELLLLAATVSVMEKSRRNTTLSPHSFLRLSMFLRDRLHIGGGRSITYIVLYEFSGQLIIIRSSLHHLLE